jgi:predicted small secreted protein
MKKIVALLAFTGFALSGCNTIEGVGKDAKATGNAIEKAAHRHEPK